MKITNEQLRALLEAEAHRARTPRSGDEFGAMFTRQLDAGQTQAAGAAEPLTAPVPGLRSVSMAGLMEEYSARAEPGLETGEAIGQMEDMFGALERYAGELARDAGADLRRAYGMLEDMGSRIAGFKAGFAGDGRQALAAMANELDVLVTTETFKFNRGDYSA